MHNAKYTKFGQQKGILHGGIALNGGLVTA